RRFSEHPLARGGNAETGTARASGHAGDANDLSRRDTSGTRYRTWPFRPGARGRSRRGRQREERVPRALEICLAVAREAELLEDAQRDLVVGLREPGDPLE